MYARDELVELVRKIKEGNYSSAEEADKDIERLTDNVLDPAAMDYLFQKDNDDLSPDDIVDRMLAYKPIRL